MITVNELFDLATGSLEVNMNKLIHHLQSFKQAWLTIFKQPFEHLINIIVLALIITICAAGLTLNNSLSHWQKNNLVYPQLMLYLDSNANPADVSNIEKALNKLTNGTVKNYQFISKAQGLAELQQDQQMKSIASDVIDANNNPLPDMFIVNAATTESQSLEKLNLQLGQLPMVDNVQLDMQYAGKVNELMSFATSIGEFAIILFGAVLALVVYNMIRLQMLLKSDAIKVSRLIGASDSFIMRPLIHYAVWQVTLATAIAVGSLHYLIKSLNAMFANFSNLFGKGFQLAPLELFQFGALWLALIIFTIFTVFLAVQWVFRNSHSH